MSCKEQGGDTFAGLALSQFGFGRAYSLYHETNISVLFWQGNNSIAMLLQILVFHP